MNIADHASRRQFMARTSAAAVLATAGSAALAAEESGNRPLRVIAYNVFACTGWPKDRARANKATALGQMPDRFACELALYEPDLLNFSESPSEAVVKQIAKRLGMKHVRFPSGSFPGTVMTRYEIAEAKETPSMNGAHPKDLFTRHWGRVTIELPEGESLIVHSAHLYPAEDPTIRLREIHAMLPTMRDDLDSGRSMLLIGDLNHSPDTEEYRLWMDAGWTDTFAKVGKGDGFTIPADDPKWRIDYVLAAGPIAKRIAESRPLFEGAFRLNAADHESFSLSDHLPQLAVFENK